MDEFTSPPAPVRAAPPGHAAATATWARVGLLGIGVAALLAVALLALGSSAAPSGTLAAGTTSNNNQVVEDLNGFGGPGFPGGRGGFGHGLGGITITAISGSNISLETADGWTRTITVDSGTTYSKSGDTIALGDLAVGDEIGFRQTLEDDGSWTIDTIAVIPPHAGGEGVKGGSEGGDLVGEAGEVAAGRVAVAVFVDDGADGGVAVEGGAAQAGAGGDVVQVRPVLPVAISSAIVTPQIGEALKPHVPQPASTRKPSTSVRPITGL